MVRVFLSVLVFVYGLTVPWAAFAAAYKCTTANGSITFSDLPCPSNSAKDEKVLGRGAGSNPLSAGERAEFKEGFLSRCKGAPVVCQCVAEYLVDTLTYEEVKDFKRGSIESKSRKAAEVCKAQSRQ